MATGKFQHGQHPASVGSKRRTRSDPCDEPSEPNLGGPQDSRRTAQTRYEHRRNQREQVHGASPEAAIPDVADFLGKSREEPGIGGLLHCSDSALPSPLRNSWCWLMTDAGSSTSASPPIPPQNGPPNNSAKPFLG